MSTFTFSRYSACLTVIVALDACTMGGSLRAPAPGPLLPPGRAAKSFFSPEAKAKALIFVVISRSNAVDIFSAKHEHKMVGRITGLKDPGRIAVDTSGYLYVANSRATSVPVYAPPYTKGPKLTLSTPGYHPYAVAVSPNGVVAVLMTCATSCPTFYTANFYAKGSTTPCVTIPVSNFPDVPYTGAFDHAGDLYLVGQIKQGPYIAEIAGGCGAKTVTPMTAGNAKSLGPLFDVHLNNEDQIVILAPEHRYIYTYKLPRRDSLGNPIGTMSVPHGMFSFSFVASGRDVWASIYLLSLDNASEFDYPAGGAAKNTINVSPSGGDVAVTPPLVP